MQTCSAGPTPHPDGSRDATPANQPSAATVRAAVAKALTPPTAAPAARIGAPAARIGAPAARIMAPAARIMAPAGIVTPTAGTRTVAPAGVAAAASGVIAAAGVVVSALGLAAVAGAAPATAAASPPPGGAAALRPRARAGNAAVAASLQVAGPAAAVPGAVAMALGNGAAVAAAAGPGGRSGPRTDPKFLTLTAGVRGKQRKLTHHRPARHEAAAAQAAAKAPPDDREAQGKAANAEKMNTAKPAGFDKAAFVKAVEEAVARQAPKNLDEADSFAGSGKADQVKGEVQGQVRAGKEASAAPIADSTAAPPDTSAAVDKPVVPMTPDQPPRVPAAPDPAQAVPDKAPPSATDFSAGPRQLDQQMSDAQVTDDQLARANEPTFTGALKDKRTAAQHSAAAPPVIRAHEGQTLDRAKGEAQQAGKEAMAAMTGVRHRSGQRVDAGKAAAKGSDEAKRSEVTATLQKVFDAMKKDVEGILTGLDKKVDDQFTAEEKTARDAFVAEHKQKMKEYKHKRYSGLRGKWRWVRDKFADLPQEANQIFVRAREGYVTRMRGVISSIADTIAAQLDLAKQRIAKGRAEMKAEVNRLPRELRALGRSVAAGFDDKFAELAQQVNDKGTALVDTMAERYSKALHSVDDEIAAEKEKNKGLISKAKDAIVGVIKAIIQLKNLLFGVLAKAASAVMLIIKDPIGFLSNLVSAVGAGLKQFMKNIATHLRNGLVAWLLGAVAQAGLQLPEKWDVLGVLKLIAGLLGLTWSFIRSRIVRKVPEWVVVAAETTVSIILKIKNEGISGLWEEIKTQIGNLKDTLFDKIVEYLVPTVLVAGIMWVISLLNPASAFVRAVKLIIDIVRFVVDRAEQIVEFVNAVLDAVIAIAKGGTGGVPDLIEKALARSVPVLIGLLAAILGLGGIAGKIKSIFQALAKPVTKAIDWVIDKIVTLAKKLWAKLKTKAKKAKDKALGLDDSPQGRLKRLSKAMTVAANALKRFGTNVVSRMVLRPILAAVRFRYGLTSLELVPDGETMVLIGVINPQKKVRTNLPVEKSAREAHDKVMAELGSEKKRYLIGHGPSVRGHAGRNFDLDMRNKLDDIGYSSGDHSDSKEKKPGTNPNPKLNWGKKGKGSWIPDHQPPDAVLAGGAIGIEFRFYPHSLTSARKQGGIVRDYIRKMKKIRKRSVNWAVGVKHEWFRPK